MLAKGASGVAGLNERPTRPATTPLEDEDTIYVDDIGLCLRQCANPRDLDLTGDVNGDSAADWPDMALFAGERLREGSDMGRKPLRIASVWADFRLTARHAFV